MRILMWAAQFLPDIGGIEVWSSQIVAELQRRGHKLMVISSRGFRPVPEDQEYEGIPVHRFGFESAMLKRSVTGIKEVGEQVAALKRSFRPHVIHLNTLNAGAFFNLRTRWAWEAPEVFTVHYLTTMGLDANGLIGHCTRSARRVTAVSQYMLDCTLDLAPECRARSSVIYNGLAMPRLAPAPLSFEAPRLLVLGRVVEDKGFDVALRAFARLREQHPRLRLTVAGDGVELPALKALAQELGISQATSFLGWVPPDSVPALINDATVMVAPSRWQEPFGLVALQGAQMGRPVVATRAGGLPEVVVDGETGLVVEREDDAGLAAAIDSLLQDPARAKAMGAAGRERARTRFSFAAMVDAYERLYRQIAERAS